MIILKTGDKAPDFKLNNQDGKSVKLSDFKGRKIVLYFYPRDDTPGCTKEACNFRDNISQLKKSDAVVLGISNDNENSHQKFISKYNLNFDLLADADKEVSNAYGVYELKSFLGRKYYGITRSTFIIDEKGKIQKIFYKVKAEQHIGEVMDVVK